MRRNRILYALGISAFIIILGYALLRELDRNQAQISNSISGVITATPAAGVGIVKTDNAYLLLFEPLRFGGSNSHIRKSHHVSSISNG